VATWDYNQFYIPAEYDVFVYFTPHSNSDVSPWQVEGGSQEGAFRIRAKHLTGLWGWESWDTAVRVYRRSYTLPAVPASCAEGGADDAEEQPEEETPGEEDEAETLPEGADCVCPAIDCLDFATSDNETLCEIPPCCLPPDSFSASGSKSQYSSPESTDGTDPDTVSDTDSSSSDEDSEERTAKDWDDEKDRGFDDGDFDDVPDDVQDDIVKNATSRTTVTNAEGEEFYTGRY